MPVDICPSDSDWELWSGGLVADSQSTEFEAHLNSCESCLDRVRNARVDDQLLHTAQLLATGELFTPGEQMSITRLVEQIKSRRGDSSDGDPDTGTLPRSEETIVGEFVAPSQTSAEVTAEHQLGSDPAGSVGLEPVSQADRVQRGPRDHYTQRDESLATPTEHELVPGLQLGAYRLVKKLGQGGMGLVFLAEHQRMKRLVALKVLPPSVTRYPTAVQRFQREVQALARLSHPNIVTAHDADEARGLHFLVMEYVDGQDLMALVKKRGPLPVGQAIDYVAQGALGLEYAHKRGLVHRDIKPSNLLVDTEGQVKLLDLGLARFSEQADDPDGQGLDLTGTGVVVGTVDYMSPEQAENTKSVDARADIYSLGCTLYFLLTGKKVYTGETVIARLMAHQTQSIPSLRSVNPSLPEALDRVYQKMVAKNREERYQTVTEVLAELGKLAPAYAGISATRFVPDVSHAALNEQHFPGEPAVAAGAGSAVTTPDTQPRGLPPRNRWWLKIAAAGAFAAALLLGVSIVLKDKEGREIARIPVEPGQSVTVQPAPGTTVSVEHGPSKQAKGSAANSAGWHGWPADAPKPAIAPFDANQARQHQEEWAAYLKVPVEYSNSIGMKFRLIPPGEFLMGSTKEQSEAGLAWINAANLNAEAFERSRIKEEGPQHAVTLSQPYCVGATEVTVAQFRAFVEASKYLTQGEWFGSGDSSSWNPAPNVKPEQVSVTWRTPGCPATDDHPVTQVTWADAVAFCNWLSEQEALFPCYRKNDNDEWERIADGAGYRLPTEAEWEYACRAGTVTQFSFGDDPALLKTHGWAGADGLGAPSLVAQKQPNPFGLFDMHGNLREWCQDWYSSEYYAESSPVDPVGPEFGSDRVMRGGRWSDHSVSCRSAFRSDISPFLRNRVGGFRVVRAAPRPPSATDLLLSSDHTWSEPENLGPELNSKLDDTGPSSSSDGLSLLFASKRPLGHVGFELWESRRESLNEPFGPPTEFPRIVNSNGDDDSPHLSVDGRQLLFASNRPGSKGGRDLYICHRSDRAAKWSAPKSLGMAINTDAWEDRPFLTPDGLTLYFCSNRPGGQGQLDVWRAVRPSIDGDFGEPTNLGPNVNTPQDELSFTVLSDGRSAVMLRLNGDQSSVVLIPVQPHSGGFGSPRALELGEAGKSNRGMNFSHDETIVYYHATRPEGHGAADLWGIRRIPKPRRPDRGLVWQGWPADAPQPAIAPFDAEQAKRHQEEWAAYLKVSVEYTNAIGMKFRLIPPGEFLMGGPDSDPLAKPVEKPQHKVTITKPFYLAVHELTREQFSKFVTATKYATDAERSGLGALSVDLATGKPKRDPMVNWRSPGFPQLPSHPVVNITWNDAVAFCAWQGEDRYRLPTEAEWEYACRAGTRTPYHMGDDAAQLVEFGNVQDAAYKDVFGPGEFNVTVRDGYVFTAPVGSFRPNPFGLYDVIGNVWEWCTDSGMRGYSSTACVDPLERQQGDGRISRGGALECWRTHTRSSIRHLASRDFAAANQGVRLALSIDLSRLNPNAEPPAATGEDQARSPAQTPLDTAPPQPLGTWKAGPAAAWLEGDYRHDGPVLGGLIDTPRTIPGVKRWNVDTAWPRGQIQDIRHSPDGKWVALGCEDGHVRILDAVTLKPTRLLPGVGPGGVLYIALDWHPDNDRIVVSSNRTVRILSRTGGPSRSFAVSATISPFAVAWNKAGTRLAIGGINTPTAIEVRTTEGELISHVADLPDQPLGTITSLAWSEDDAQLWAYGSRGRCAAYQADSGQELWSFATKADPVPSGIRSRFSRDGWFACGDLNEVHLYNPDRKLVHTLPTVGVGIAWHPEGRLLFAGTSQWDRDTGRKLVEGQNGFPAVSWSPDGSQFLGAEQLSLREHNERGEPTGREVVSIRGWLPLRDLRWSPDGQRVAVDCYNIGPHVRELIFDESGGECPVHPAFEGRTLLAWSPDGTTAYAWGRDSSLPDSRNAVWMINRDGSARPVWTPAESDLAPSDLKTLSGAVSADGRFLALAVPGGVQVLDEHHKPIRQIMTGGKAVPLVAWNPVSQQLTILVDGEPLRFATPTRGWEVETRGEPIAGLADIRAPRWSPDGQWLSVNRIGRLGLSGKPHPDNALVLRVASWRADSEELINAGDFVSHFDLFAASSKPTRVRHINGGVVSADWNPRGHLIATCQYQSTLTAWKTSDLLPQWTTVLLSQDQSATFSGAGELLNAQPERFDDKLVYYIEREAGSIEMLTPTQFRTLVAEADAEPVNRQSAR